MPFALGLVGAVRFCKVPMSRVCAIRAGVSLNALLAFVQIDVWFYEQSNWMLAVRGYTRLTAQPSGVRQERR
jgi:hypothetical protein